MAPRKARIHKDRSLVSLCNESESPPVCGSHVRGILPVVLCCIGNAGMAANVTTQVPTPLDLAGSLQQPLAGRSLPDENSLVRSIYSTTGRLLWSTGDGFTPQARELLALVHSADVLGLRALDYGDAQFDAVTGRFRAANKTGRLCAA